MKSCGHSRWLGLGTQEGKVFFQETDRLQNLVEGLPSPDTRYPSLLVLIGRKKKSLVLQELVSVEGTRKLRIKQGPRGIHLHIDTFDFSHGNPVLYADSYLPTELVGNSIFPTERCHEIIKRSKHPLPLTGIEAADYLFARLLRPFSNVFCLFLADMGGMQSVVERLVSWLEKGQAAALPKTANPSLILVVESDAPGPKAEREIKNELLHMLEHKSPRSIYDHFFDITIVSIFAEGKPSLRAPHRPLKELLLDALDQAQARRLRIGMLFSATHFAAFFRHACDHFVRTRDEAFNFIKASRLRNPVSLEIDKHVSRFLEHIRSPLELSEFAIPVIASSLLLNAYPPDMHVFQPRDVFQTLYMNACRHVGRISVSDYNGSAHTLLPSAFVKLVEHHFSLWFANFERDSGVTSAGLHLENLQRFRSVWQRIYDDELCLTCLDQTPEYKLPCKHMICEACIQKYGNSHEHPWVFTLDKCLLCRSSFPQQATVKIRDPSRGLRVLSLDGGGIRGIVHLMFLKVLQERIGLPYPVQENFDVTVGTSVGAIVNLVMYKAGLPIDDSIRVFEELASMAFQPRWVSGIPVISYIEKIIVSYIEDGWYSPRGLERALKQIFGDTMTMFDISYATTIGTKIAVTATTAAAATSTKSSDCLFRNYKRVGERYQDCGYHIIRPQDGYSDPRVWQIARCASAAPVYFAPLDIPGVGTYQDGGVWKNNPVDLVNPEIEAIAPLTEEPLIVSVGTGLAEEKDAPDTSLGRGDRKDGCFVRLAHAFNNLLNGKKSSQNFNNQRSMAPEMRYFRFDVNYQGKEPRLDQVRQIPRVKATAQEQFSDSKDLHNLAYHCIVFHFHFELEAMPRKRGDQYLGVGHILCDLKRSHPAYRALLHRLSLGAARFYVNDELIPGEIEDCSSVDMNGNFRKRVEFESVNGKLSIALGTKEWQPLDISGSPFSIEKRIKDQHLDAYFGQASHKKRKWLDQGVLPAKRRRRIIR